MFSPLTGEAWRQLGLQVDGQVVVGLLYGKLQGSVPTPQNVLVQTFLYSHVAMGISCLTIFLPRTPIVMVKNIVNIDNNFPTIPDLNVAGYRSDFFSRSKLFSLKT